MQTEEFDTNKLMDELKWEPSVEAIKKLHDDHLKRLENEKYGTMLYNPCEKIYSSYTYCKGKYGQDIADKMFRAKKENNGQLAKEDYAELMSLCQHKVEKQAAPVSKPATVKSPFIMIDHAIIKNPKVRKILKKSMMLYLYLRTYIVREKFPGDHLNLHARYFKKGKLAASISIRKLAQDFDIDQKTVTAYLQEMSEHKVIEIEKILAADSYDNQIHNVYVLGRHDSNKMETYLIEKLAISDS